MGFYWLKGFVEISRWGRRVFLAGTLSGHLEYWAIWETWDTGKVSGGNRLPAPTFTKVGRRRGQFGPKGPFVILGREQCQGPPLTAKDALPSFCAEGLGRRALSQLQGQGPPSSRTRSALSGLYRSGLLRGRFRAH